MMDRTLFDAEAKVNMARLSDAAAALADERWARFCLKRGENELRAGRSRRWVPQLTVLAALRFGREAEFLPVYDQFLLALDSFTKGDWHKRVSEQGLNGSLLAQSGRLAQTVEAFNPEFDRIVRALGPSDEGPVADIGCGGGLWAIKLATIGYRVIGTEHHDFLVQTARQNAINVGVSDRVEFRLDDICRSALPAGLCTRALCIGVTPTLPDVAAFEGLVHHLDEITRPAKDGQTRRVILGSNRWGPSRMTAVQGILDAARHDKQSVAQAYSNALRRLSLVEACWWLHPRHVDRLSERFRTVRFIGEIQDPIDGTRVELLLE
jgi:SAM-dependent methyltransferase